MRPYNVQNIFDNLHKAYPKKLLTAALQELTSSGKLEQKKYGAVALFVALRPDAGKEIPKFDDESELIEKRILCNDLAKQVADLRKQQRSERSNVNLLLAQLEHRMRELEKECVDLSKGLKISFGVTSDNEYTTALRLSLHQKNEENLIIRMKQDIATLCEPRRI